MADYNSVPLGRSDTGAAVVLHNGSVSPALRVLMDADKLRQTLEARTKVAAEKKQQKADKEFNSKMATVSDEGGPTYAPLLQEKANALYKELESVAVDPSLDSQQKAFKQQQKVDQYNREAKASVQADRYVADLAHRVAADPRIDRDKAWSLLHRTQYDADGNLLAPTAYDVRTADKALGTGREHLNGVEVMKAFAHGQHPDEVTYGEEALPGGQGVRRTAASDFYELTPDGKIARDPQTNERIVKATPELLARFDADPINRQYLNSFEDDHERELTGIVEKMKNYEQLTDEEHDIVAREQTTEGRRLNVFKHLLASQAYGRESVISTNKPALRPAAGRGAGRGAGAKPTYTGGSEYTPELIGGTGASGTHGFLALAASEPLKRVKADGTTTGFKAKGLHRQFVILKEDQSAEMVTNNTSSQELEYIKPQLYLTTSTGNIVTPPNPGLFQAYQRGDRQPLLNWVKSERERNPKIQLAWHFLAVPAQPDKLDAGSGADRIFERLRAQRTGSPGDTGYHSDDVLRDQAHKMASHQPASMVIPYKGADKLAIDAATNYVLREPKRKQRMQQEMDRFNRETAPRPATAPPTSPKKSIGVDFGSTPKAPTPTARPDKPYKAAGTKKTGISF